MPTPRRVPCVPCKESHLKCDGQRPVCERCRIKKLECRLPSKTTRFIKSSEGKFSRDQRWVNSRARKFCFDKAIPLGAPDGLDPPPGDPPGDPLGRNVGTGDGPSSLDGSPREEESVGSPAQAGMPSHHHHLEMLADAATAGGWVGGNDAAVAATVPFPRPNDRILSLPTVVSYGLEHGVSPPQIGYPADAGMLSGGGVENTHPAITAVRSRHAEHRQFPLQDFREACLLKYYLDQVAGWLDIADPDRHFELVIPLIARSKPHILSAILALSARYLLCSLPAPDPLPEKLWYLDQLSQHVTPSSVTEYVQQCIPALGLFDQVFDGDELEGIVVVAVLLRQVELLGEDYHPGPRPEGDGTPPAPQTLLPTVNDILHSASFKARFPHSGLVQAAYLMVLRQEVYYALSSGKCPAVTSARCSPDISFIHETTIHMIEVLQLYFGDGASDSRWDELSAQQRHLENNTLMGIQPIFHREPDRSNGELLPLLWFNSRTEMYCIQLAKMARAILTIGRHRTGPDSAAAQQQTKDLIMELHGIAADRTESEHGTFHASVMAMMYYDVFTDGAERYALRGAADRLLRMSRWPFRNVLEFCSTQHLHLA